MLGLIKKDILMIKNNLKTIIFAILIYIFLGITNDIDISFFIPFITFMITISTFSYDDFNKWHSYAITLPNGRKNMVRSKYISSLILIFISAIIGIILSTIIAIYKNNLNIEEILSTISGIIVAIILLQSIIFPILFKYGSEKGRISLFIIFFGITAVIGIISELFNINTNNISKILNFIDTYYLIIIPIIIILILIISYKISQKIYSKKEF